MQMIRHALCFMPSMLGTTVVTNNVLVAFSVLYCAGCSARGPPKCDRARYCCCSRQYRLYDMPVSLPGKLAGPLRSVTPFYSSR